MDGVHEGYIKLACAVAETRASRYRRAYKNYLENPNADTRREVTYMERKLRGPITNLDDAGIRALQQQVIRKRSGRRKT